MAEDSSAPVYVVLGATGGIGSELSRRLAAGGARLVLGARDGERLQILAEELGALPVGLDATKTGEVNGLFAEAVEEHGRIDGAVNCVGSFMLKPAHLTKDEEWAETMALNLGTAFGTIKAAARNMPDGGSVVLLSSVAARVGLANHEAVAAAKAGVIGLAMSAATTYLPRGLRINVVAPGLVQTPMTEKITASATSRKASEELHPMGRLGEPGDVASAIRWLLSTEAGWVTGQVFGVDGGLSTLHPMPRRAAK